jgi:SNF2 family DNA or RNA helicase
MMVCVCVYADMGLGKTLQTICVLALDHEEQCRLAAEKGETYTQLPHLGIIGPNMPFLACRA